MVAVCRQDRQDRADVTEWITPDQWKLRYQAAELSGDLGDDGNRLLGAAAIILSRDIGFEYPGEAAALLAGLEAAGVDRCRAARPARYRRGDQRPPRRGARAQGHEQYLPGPCACSSAPRRGARAGSGHRLSIWSAGGSTRPGRNCWPPRGLPGPGSQLAGATAGWLDQAATTWIPVMEARPEVTLRRDSGTPAAWLAGKRVLVLGCGALGAPAAEICVRADAAEVTVADNGIVSPRHPGQPAISRTPTSASTRPPSWPGALNQMHADKRVSALPQDIVITVLTEQMHAAQFDLIIDATANAAVASRLEYCRAQSPGSWPPVMTMLIGHQARRGIVALARPGASGAGRDILRKLGLAACVDQAGQLADIARTSSPTRRAAELFQPEPGCSDPTFTGSAAETGALAAHLMTAGLDALAGRAGSRADQPLAVGRRPPRPARRAGSEAPSASWLGWPNDLIVRDQAARLRGPLLRGRDPGTARRISPQRTRTRPRHRDRRHAARRDRRGLPVHLDRHGHRPAARQQAVRLPLRPRYRRSCRN